MLKLEVSTAEREALHYERFHHPHPRVQRKMEAVYLKSQQLPHYVICQLTDISSKYYEKFEPFKQAISACLAAASTEHKDELKSLLTLHFQTFEKAQTMPV